MMAVDEIADGLWLPGRAEAEETISWLMSEGRPAFALAVLATEVPRINEQFGYQAGDRVLATVARRLANAAGPSRELFRWSATSFLIVSRSLHPVSQASKVNGATSMVFGVRPEEHPRALIDRIDHYIAARLACFEAA